MAFTLGATTLPTPKTVNPSNIRTGSRITGVTGKEYWDVFSDKREWNLKLDWVTKATHDSIMNEYYAATTKTFAVTETNWTDSYTVLVDVISEKLMPGQFNYYEMELRLTEVE